MAVTEPRGASADRRLAALAHLGVPMFGPFLPLVLRSDSRSRFVRDHAEQSLTFQCGFLAIYAVICVLAIVLRVLPPAAMVVALSIAVAVEVPQVVRALTGRPPLRIGPPMRLDRPVPPTWPSASVRLGSEPVTNELDDEISAAIVTWVGWRDPTRSWPARDPQRLDDRFGRGSAARLMPQVAKLYDEFCESDARHTLPYLTAITAAEDRFRLLHPELDEEAVRALAWCYSWDYK